MAAKPHGRDLNTGFAKVPQWNRGHATPSKTGSDQKCADMFRMQLSWQPSIAATVLQDALLWPDQITIDTASVTLANLPVSSRPAWLHCKQLYFVGLRHTDPH
jgi:hypothetical protein